MVNDIDYNNYLAHIEYRVANGELGTNMTYKQGRCLALVKDVPYQSKAEKALGLTLVDKSYTVGQNVIQTEFIQVLFDIVTKNEIPKPFTDTIISDNLKEKPLVTRSKSYGFQNYYDSFITRNKKEVEKENKKKNLFDETYDLWGYQDTDDLVTEWEYEDAKEQLLQYSKFKPISLDKNILRGIDLKHLSKSYCDLYRMYYDAPDIKDKEILEYEEQFSSKDEMVKAYIELAMEIYETVEECKSIVERYESLNVKGS
jgi:hypothetical protein